MSVPMSVSEMTEAIRCSSLSELSWVDASGEPQARGTVALVRDEAPVLAFTYADEAVARAVAGAARLLLTVTESRSTDRGFRPVLVQGRPRLVEDASGDIFAARLLEQELRRYPPARLYADSPLLQREHWWYLPRLIVEIDVDSIEPLSARTEPQDHLLVVAGAGGLVVRVARLVEAADDLLTLEVSDGPAPPGRAVLFGQDASFPDLELWAQWRYRGRWDGATFAVEESPERTGLGRPPGLVQRWRRQRTLERRCVTAIPRP